jgi:hypothetical protein
MQQVSSGPSDVWQRSQRPASASGVPVAATDVKRLLAATRSLPVVEAGGGHEAATVQEAVAEGRSLQNGLRPRVDQFRFFPEPTAHVLPAAYSCSINTQAQRDLSQGPCIGVYV